MTLKTKRDNNIKEALRYHGLSVIIKSEKEFNFIKKFLGENLYLNYVPQMSTKPTGIIIFADDNSNFSTGSVGCVKYQKENFIRVVEFDDFFKLN